MSTLKRKGWFKLIEEWEMGCQTQPAFCEAKGVNLSTFVYYRGQYLQSLKRPESKSVSLLPVQVSNIESTQSSVKVPSAQHREIYIKTPSGFEVRCTGQDIESLSKLLGMVLK